MVRAMIGEFARSDLELRLRLSETGNRREKKKKASRLHGKVSAPFAVSDAAGSPLKLERTPIGCCKASSGCLRLSCEAEPRNYN